MNNAKPTSYFFTDHASFNQDEWRAFGPRGQGDERANLFSLSSAFSSWTTPNAYAICKGVALVQPQTGQEAHLVNVVFRPLDQPFPGIKIKYFVYRGLLRSDFFIKQDNVDIVLPIDTPEAHISDFIRKINTGFASFYSSREQQVPPFLAKYIGYEPSNQADNLLLDDFFFKQATYSGGNEDTDKAFELPVVQGGASLGRFASNTTFAMDVVLDYGDFREPLNDEGSPVDDSKFVFNLSYARSWRVELDIWWTMGAGVIHQRPRYQEQIFQFIDILAFYGAHASSGIVKSKVDGVWYNQTANNIYSLLELCFGKNRWYLYIQSDRTRSYNFYGNYVVNDENSNTIKKGYSESTLLETTYASDGWPILIDEGIQAHGESFNSLFLQFTKTPNNNNAMFYAQVGNVTNAQHNNFCDAGNLSLPDGPDGIASDWTRPLQCVVPAIEQSESKRNICSFAILFYQGKEYGFLSGEEIDDNGAPVPVYSAPNYFDEVFDGIIAVSSLKGQENPIYSVLSNQRFKLVSQYYNRTNNGIAAVQTVKITDAIDTGDTTMPLLKRVTYIAESVDTLSDAIAVSAKLNNGGVSSSSSFSSARDGNTYQLPQPYYYERQLFTDGLETVTGLKLKAANDALPDRIMLGMSESEHDSLKALVLNIEEVQGGRNSRIMLLDLFEDGNELISVEGVIYQKYKLGVIAEDWQRNLKLHLPEQDIIVYGIDRYYYYTEAYSRYMPDMLLNIEYLFVNEVI